LIATDKGRAVADFVGWAKDLSDQRRKQERYPRVEKSQLFELGYIAERSGHSRGSAVDLTVIDMRARAELDIGGAYDVSDTRSWPTDQTVGPAQRTMTGAGFRPLAEEWWHFTLQDEPYPDAYFNFPVARD